MSSLSDSPGLGPRVPLPQLSYDVAYRVLPQFVFTDFDQVRELCETMPDASAGTFYTLACEGRGIEPVAEEDLQFKMHLGKLADGREYFVLEYPVPRPVDYTGMTPERLEREHHQHVLAPHFSAMLPEDGDQVVRYFVLGQAPLGGGTTLRSVSAEGVNANLGPGPVAELAAFLQAIESHLGRYG
jgi:hypothetical protein